MLIINGVCFDLSFQTERRIRKENRLFDGMSPRMAKSLQPVIDRIKANENVWKDLEEARQQGILTGDWDYYSDFHKDVYGFRPRWEIAHYEELRRQGKLPV